MSTERHYPDPAEAQAIVLGLELTQHTEDFPGIGTVEVWQVWGPDADGGSTLLGVGRSRRDALENRAARTGAARPYEPGRHIARGRLRLIPGGLA